MSVREGVKEGGSKRKKRAGEGRSGSGFREKGKEPGLRDTRRVDLQDNRLP